MGVRCCIIACGGDGLLLYIGVWLLSRCGVGRWVWVGH